MPTIVVLKRNALGRKRGTNTYSTVSHFLPHLLDTDAMPHNVCTLYRPTVNLNFDGRRALGKQLKRDLLEPVRPISSLMNSNELSI